MNTEDQAYRRLREVFAEVWSRRVPVPGRWPDEYVVPIDARLARAVREAFVGVMEFAPPEEEGAQQGR